MMLARLSACLLVGVCVAFLVGYAGGEVSSGGSIQGSVRFSGAVPRLDVHHATKTPEICGSAVPNEEIVTGAQNALGNVVVWIDGIQQGAPTRPAPLTLSQQHCRFVPHVAAITSQSPLTIHSSDATLHNVHAFLGKRTLFNLALPTKGVRIQRTLAQPGVVRFQCDAGHTWMSAFVHVFDHPYYAVTTENGGFRLENVPAGRHTVKAWHERFGTQTQEVVVQAGVPATASFEFAAR